MAERGLFLQKWKHAGSGNNSPQLMKAELDTPVFSLSLSYGEPQRDEARTITNISRLAEHFHGLITQHPT